MVYLITNSLLLGVIETVTHCCIDFAKCEDLLGFHQDQALHVGLKVGYALVL